jgi:hypothetical protein
MMHPAIRLRAKRDTSQDKRAGVFGIGVSPNEVFRPTNLGLAAWSPDRPEVIKNYF